MIRPRHSLECLRWFGHRSIIQASVSLSVFPDDSPRLKFGHSERPETGRRFGRIRRMSTLLSTKQNLLWLSRRPRSKGITTSETNVRPTKTEMVIMIRRSWNISSFINREGNQSAAWAAAAFPVAAAFSDEARSAAEGRPVSNATGLLQNKEGRRNVGYVRNNSINLQNFQNALMLL